MRRRAGVADLGLLVSPRGQALGARATDGGPFEKKRGGVWVFHMGGMEKPASRYEEDEFDVG